jgi:hypothetical protein
MLDYNEFHGLVTRRSPGIEDEVVMNMFDNGIQLASEQVGEEIDSITLEAFISVATEQDLVSLAESAYVHPSELVKRTPVHVSSTNSRKQNAIVRMVVPKGVGDKGEDEDELIRRSPQEVFPKQEMVAQVIKRALKQNFLFRHLADAALAELVGYMRPREVSQGECVIREGDPGDYFYVIESGAYDVFVDRVQVHTHIVKMNDAKHPGFGELALMYAKPRNATIMAAEPGVLWALDRLGFRRVQMHAAPIDALRTLRKVRPSRHVGLGDMRM